MASRLPARGRRATTTAAEVQRQAEKVANAKVAIPPRSKSNDALLEEDEEMNTRPPLLKHRNSAYFDALQQLDEHEDEQEGARPGRRATVFAQPDSPGMGSVAGRLMSMVRARSNFATASKARRRTTISGELRRRAAEAGECVPPVSALVLHRTSSDERVGAVEISAEGGEASPGAPPTPGVRKAPSGDAPKAFAFMAPEPFVADRTSSARLRSSLCPV